MTTLRIARRADAQIRRIEEWWKANREKAPSAFAVELADCFVEITQAPQLAQRHSVARGAAVQRVLLPKSRYHIYFTYDQLTDIVSVLAVWHSSRGRRPHLM